LMMIGPSGIISSDYEGLVGCNRKEATVQLEYDIGA